MQDSKAISLAKAISWRTTGSLATFAIVFYATGRLDLAAAVGGLETVVKIGLFYAHERVWARLVKLTFFEKRVVHQKHVRYDITPVEHATAVELRSQAIVNH